MLDNIKIVEAFPYWTSLFLNNSSCLCQVPICFLIEYRLNGKVTYIFDNEPRKQRDYKKECMMLLKEITPGKDLIVCVIKTLMI